MMGRLSDLADLGRSLLPYITWAHEPTTAVLLQLSALSTVGAVFVYPYVPWRFVFLAAGELAFVAGHPRVFGIIVAGGGGGAGAGGGAGGSKGAAGATGVQGEQGWERSVKRWRRRFEELVEEDGWTEEVLRGHRFTAVEQYENERWADGQWTGDITSESFVPFLQLPPSLLHPKSC